MKNFILSIYTLLQTKLLTLFFVICAFLAPVVQILLTVGLFILADTIIGIWRAIKQKEKVTSRKASKLISKTALYGFAVLLIFTMDRVIVGEFIKYFTSIPYFLTKAVAVTFISIELKSIDESFTAITGVSIWDRFKKLLARAKETKDDIKDLTK